MRKKHKVQVELRALANIKQAQKYQRFFKCAKGEYSYGDYFLGVKVPCVRRLAKKYSSALEQEELSRLLKSPFHEERYLALVILVERVRKVLRSFTNREDILVGLEVSSAFYRSHLKYVNNWDLVDISAPYLLGARSYYANQPQQLFSLAKSKNLWFRRVAMLACFYFIRQNSFHIPLKIAAQLIGDKHDLMHKAVGWMLREIGKRDPSLMLKFLKCHYAKMSRTTLRYAIEKLTSQKRSQILVGRFN